MYEIYINGTLLSLMKSKDLDLIKVEKNRTLISKYSGQKKFLLNHIDLLEKSNRYDWVILHTTNYKQMKKDFNSLFMIEQAAGGIVKNEHEEILAIFRRGLWDLPKGKLDPGEKKREAAIREVMEETGVFDLSFGEFKKTTYHVFKRKIGTRILKKVRWYEMYTHKQDLIPEKSEGIQKAEWVSCKTFLKRKEKTFPNIYNLMLKYVANK